MRNLKKVLALTLVLALSLSMVISAGAAKFPDVKDTDANAAAYSLLADLKIAQGYDDGTFKPDENLTRETAVTFIFRMATGQASADYMKGSTKFKDVAADRWSAGYINWASEKNIVQGDPDGTFAPSRTVSVAELSKMMVVAMGYDVKNYNFPWGFVDKAQDLGLLNGLLNQSANTPATRGMTSVVIKNGLLNDGRVEIIGDNVTKLKSFAESRFNITKGVVRLNGTGNLNASASQGKDQVTLNNLTFKYEGNVDHLFGREVTVWYKNTDGSTSGTPAVPSLTATDSIVSVVAKGSETVVAVAASKISATDSTVTVDGKKYDFSGKLTPTVMNYGATTPTALTVGVNSNVMVYGVDDDSNGVIDYVFATEASVNKISSISAAGRIQFAAVADAAVAAQDAVTYRAYEGIAKGDYVYAQATKSVYTKADGTVTVGTVYDISKAKTVSNVQYTKLATDNVTYTFGDSTYKMSNVTVGTPALGTSYDLILSPTGFIKAVTPVASTTTTVYGVIVSYNNGTYGAEGYTGRSVVIKGTDGANKMYTLADSVNVGTLVTKLTGWNHAKVLSGVKLSLNADGIVSGISEITSAATTLAYDKDKKLFTDSTTATYSYTDNSVVFVVDSVAGTVKAYKGSAIPAFAAEANNLTGIAASGTSIQVLDAAVLAKPIDSSSNTGFIQYAGMGYENSQSVYLYKVAYNDGTEVLNVSSTTQVMKTSGGAVTAVPYYATIVNNNGAISLTPPAALTSGIVTERVGDVVYVGTSLRLKSDATVLIVDTTSTTAGSYKALKAFGTLDDVTEGVAIDYIKNANNYITFAVVYNVVGGTGNAIDASISDALAAIPGTAVSVTEGTDSNLFTKMGINLTTIQNTYGVTVNVTSSVPAVITTAGAIAYPDAAATSVDVTFTVSKTGGTTQSKTVTVAVPRSAAGVANEEITNAKTALTTALATAANKEISIAAPGNIVTALSTAAGNVYGTAITVEVTAKSVPATTAAIAAGGAVTAGDASVGDTLTVTIKINKGAGTEQTITGVVLTFKA